MKRTGNLFDRIVERDNLRLAVSKAIRGKRHRPDARDFVSRLEEKLLSIRQQLMDGTVQVGEYHQFIIHDPKRRTITAPCFRERVIHHALINICEPVFERFLIVDTFACRRRRGRLTAIDRASQFARSFSWYLKLDIRKYFESISHPLLLVRLVRRIKDRRVLDLFERIVSSHNHATRRGLPIGSLTSQHLANFFLGWLDRRVKERHRMRGYVRYMDDMIIWSNSRSVLRDLRCRMEDELRQDFDLELKQADLNRSSHGVDFLGCRLFPSRTILNRRSRNRFRTRLVEYETMFAAGLLGVEQLQSRVTALTAFTTTPGIDSWHFRRSVIEKSPVSGLRPPTG